MPIILKNMVSYSTNYTDKQGVERELSVSNGDDVEPLDLPTDFLIELQTMMVIRPGGDSEVPAFVKVAAVEGTTHRKGTVTTASIPQADLTPEDEEKAKAEAERLQNEIYEETSRRADAAEAALEQAAAEAEWAAKEQAANDRLAAAEAKAAEAEAKTAEVAPEAEPDAPAAEAKRGPGRPAKGK